MKLFKKDVSNETVIIQIDKELIYINDWNRKYNQSFLVGIRNTVGGAVFSFFTSGILILLNGAIQNWTPGVNGLPYWAAVLIVFVIAGLLVFPVIYLNNKIKKNREELRNELYKHTKEIEVKDETLDVDNTPNEVVENDN